MNSQICRSDTPRPYDDRYTMNHDAIMPGSVAVVLGTRPEIIKLAFVIKGLGESASVIHTGQHFDEGLSRIFLDVFQLPEPVSHLGVGGLSRAAQIGATVSTLDRVFEERGPNVIVVQGDTNTTLAGALAANAREIPIVHVEAGLRSHDRKMPEEHNRVLTDHLADVLCAPTTGARQNALDEGIAGHRIVLTGNTVVEAVRHLMPDGQSRRVIVERHGLEPGAFALSTFHRPENVDDPERLTLVLEQLAKLDLPVLLPLHPRSLESAHRSGLDAMLAEIRVVEPVGYREFLALSAESAFLVSDSGGIQEEATIYKRPIIVVRRSTERPEVIGSFARLVGVDSIAATAAEWLHDLPAVHRELAELDSPYGDGTASERIVRVIREMTPE